MQAGLMSAPGGYCASPKECEAIMTAKTEGGVTFGGGCRGSFQDESKLIWSATASHWNFVAHLRVTWKSLSDIWLHQALGDK